MSSEPWAGTTRTLVERRRDPASPRTPSWHEVLVEGQGTETPGGAREDRGRGRRAKLADVSLTQAGVECEVRITLTTGDATFTGASSCVAAPAARRLAVARATAQAVNELLGDDVKVEVLSLDVMSSSDVPTRIASSLLLVTPDDSEILVGVALESERSEIGVARATLAAVNRRLMIELA